MTDYQDELITFTYKLLELQEKTGYDIVQENGQRKFGPPPNWSGPPPPKGCEVFIGKLPRQIFEDELVPIFARLGKIYEMRLMMDFSGFNRGYAFVTYTRREDAAAAIRELNGCEIRPGRHIGVVKSVDNCRLFFGGIPQSKTKTEMYEELSKKVTGIVDVIFFKNCFDRRKNRGFAFVEFSSHRAAAMAKRALVPGCVKLWDQDVTLDWAKPELNIDDELMKKVKVLHVRNFLASTTPDTIQDLFETTINAKVEHVKKMYDYAFIHFFERDQAELAMANLQRTEVEGSTIEIKWAKPVDRKLYRIQKSKKGNAKFNHNMELTQTLLLNERQFDKKEYENGKEDEGISSGCDVEWVCGLPGDGTSSCRSVAPVANYMLAPAKLDAMCKMYSWAPPNSLNYNYQQLVDLSGTVMGVCHVELPQVGLPLLSLPSPTGPLVTRGCPTAAQARVEAAEVTLQCIEALRVNVERSSATPVPVYSPLVQPVPTYNVSYDCNVYARPPPIPTNLYQDCTPITI